jgi:hypothetical protein
VTYRDGTVVYVNPNATQVVASTATGAVPLSIALMNTPTSRYYANPVGCIECDHCELSGGHDPEDV